MFHSNTLDANNISMQWCGIRVSCCYAASGDKNGNRGIKNFKQQIASTSKLTALASQHSGAGIAATVSMQ